MALYVILRCRLSVPLGVACGISYHALLINILAMQDNGASYLVLLINSSARGPWDVSNLALLINSSAKACEQGK